MDGFSLEEENAHLRCVIELMKKTEQEMKNAEPKSSAACFSLEVVGEQNAKCTFSFDRDSVVYFQDRDFQKHLIDVMAGCLRLAQKK